MTQRCVVRTNNTMGGGYVSISLSLPEFALTYVHVEDVVLNIHTSFIARKLPPRTLPTTTKGRRVMRSVRGCERTGKGRKSEGMSCNSINQAINERRNEIPATTKRIEGM